MARTNYDSPWKNILNQFLPAFMEFCLPQAAATIDWSRGYIALDKELNAIGRRQKTSKRIADALFKVWLKDGNEAWLLLHIEIQAQEEACFPERMFIYNYRIFDRYQKPIISVAILADDNPAWRPTCYERLSSCNKLYFEFATVKLLDYAKQRQSLSGKTNPFAIVVWAHLEALQTRGQPQKRLNSKLAITRALYEHGFSKEYILDLFSFVDWVLALPKPLGLEYEQKIEQLEGEKKVAYITSIERIGIERGMRKGIERGMQQGIQQGQLEGERLLLDSQLKHRFGRLPIRYKNLLAEADKKKLLLLGKRLLDAKTLEEIFK